ncbi:MAG TPA: phenylalanine--tRNA ligase subunit beta [Candidatus Kapabacteria bacterium]|jgi:phenylalanyl-tRNA synthetase beta chain
MRISLNWLAEYISISFSSEELAERLTMLGLEIDAIERTGEKWDKVFVGEVLDVVPHPNADKLRLTRVSIGNSEPLGIVCGAPNVRAGLKVAVATIGADLGEGMIIKKAKIRGESSEGMLCSERELGMSEHHEGIWELPEHLAIGVPLADALHLRDTIFEVGITPNRADCLSHIGIAREIRAITGASLTLPSVSIAKEGGEISNEVKISLPQPELCPRYVAKLVRNVTIKPSPEWMKRKLEAAGLRPINNVVDITNFVLMECGHPLHAFDFDAVDGDQIVVRTAAGFAEEYTTLDSKKRKLPPDALLITDGKKPLGIAGVMGGENSEIRESTKNVLIESAYFLPASIRRTAKQLGISSDAAYRFERGTDFDNVQWAAERAAQLIAELAEGEIVDGFIDAYPKKVTKREFSFRPARANMLLGMSIPDARMQEIFKRLEIGITNAASDCWRLTSPSYRVDLEREEDAIEEIARIVGYDAIPTSTFERAPLTGMREPLRPREFETLVRDTLLALGVSECVSDPLVSEKNALQFHPHPVELINPLNLERGRMRTNMAINLLEAAHVSERFGAEGLRLFEIGNIFHYATQPQRLGQVMEGMEIGILISGIQEPKNPYNTAAIPADLLLMKGITERFLDRLGVRNYEYAPGAQSFFDGEQALRIVANGGPLAHVGRLAPAITKSYDLRNDVWLALFYHAGLMKLVREQREKPAAIEPLPKYPSIERDIAIVMSDTVTVSTVISNIRNTAPQKILRSVSLFDQFQSKEMKQAHERSLAFHLLFRADERTLEEHEVDELMVHILAQLESSFHARLRQ